MYLKRLEISGFKSFARETELLFEPGITAIVGPNGSGKSNIADAIRWVLGESSGRALRSRRNEELVFAGTEKRARGSFAQVSLLLDNTTGSLDIEAGEIELVRRLYRSGESEYLINQTKSRLADVEHLLARAGFGQNSYSVIAQGMIDQFILASPAERRVLFEEAAGIKQHEIKREQALKRLAETESNLVRARDIVAELEPRLRLLEREREAAAKRQTLETALALARSQYLASAQHDLVTTNQAQLAARTKLEQTITELTTKITDLRAQQHQLEQTQTKSNRDLGSWTTRLERLEIRRDQAQNKLVVERAELNLMQEREDPTTKLTQTQATLTTELNQVQQHLTAKTKLAASTGAQLEAAQTELDKITTKLLRRQQELAKRRLELQDTEREEYLRHALGLVRELNRELLARDQLDLERTRLVIHKVGRLLSLASDAAKALLADQTKTLQEEIGQLFLTREDRTSVVTDLTIKLRSLELDITHLKSTVTHTQTELKRIQSELGQARPIDQFLITKRQQKVAALEAELAKLSQEISVERKHLAKSQSDTQAWSEQNRQLNTGLETLQAKLDEARAALEDRRLELTRYELQRQDLIEEAGRWQLDLESLKPAKLNPAEAKARVAELESQLSHLAGASTAAVGEYKEVAERHGHLTAQISDLTAAATDLEQIIKQLEALISTQFETGFGQIAEHFDRYFKELFNGGQTSLSLQRDEDRALGITIQAAPPGKRTLELAMLSGGERSLAGIALLAAILATNPSPFVVLDEVDAALDEANSSRYAAILSSLAYHAQLIVITHNRQTMKSAGRLLGVTMNEHHVSQVLAVRLTEAKELATQET